MRQQWALGSSLAAALALAAPAAQAAIEIEVEVASTEIADGALGGVGVDCPPGAVAIGGGTQVSDDSGIDLTGNAPRFGETSLLALPDGPAAAPTGWEGSAANGSGAAGSLHVGALCSSAVAVSAVVASAPVGAGTFAGATPECPEGTVAIGGGFALGNLSLRVSETAPRFPDTGPLAATPEGTASAPDAWTVFARNPGGGSPILKVVALCAELPDVEVLVAKRNTMANGGPAGGEVDCAPGATALAGGIASLNPLGLTVTSSAPRFPGPDPELAQQPDGTSPAPTGWYARGRNDSPDVLSVARAAICVPEPGAASACLVAVAAVGVLARVRRRAADC